MATTSAKKSRDQSLSAGQSAANNYWKKVTDANEKLETSMKDLMSNYDKSITDYQSSVSHMLSEYNNNVQAAQTEAQGKLDNSIADLDKAMSKYTGENAYRDTLKLGQQGAASSAGKAASEATGAARAAGLTPAQAAMLGTNSTINAYNQGLDTQQAAAANQYAGAANAAWNKAQLSASNIKDMLANSMAGYGNALNGQMQGASNTLGAAGNKMQAGLQGQSALAANTIGAAGQEVANYQNQAQVGQSSQNLGEKVWNDFASFFPWNW